MSGAAIKMKFVAKKELGTEYLVFASKNRKSKK